MECNVAPSTDTTALTALQAAVPAAPAAAPAPAALLLAFAAVPDPRRARGRRFPLAALLALAVAALLADQRSVLAIAQWAARQRPATLRALGLPAARPPHQSTLQRLFRRLDVAALSAAVGAAFAAAAPAPTGRGSQGVAIDGKAQRGRLAFAGAGGATVHALTAYLHEADTVLAQEEIRSTAEKTEAELTVAPALIARVAWPGRVLTGDALFCQRHLCRQVRAAGGDYLVLVRENQPTLLHDVALLFDPPPDQPAPLPLLDRREAATLEKGHGRTHDQRHLVASTDLNGYLDWPGLAQVFRLERTWRAGGVAHRQVTYGVTSLPPDVADAARLLALKRGHWRIENRLHRTKDVTLGEDASPIRLGAGPMALAVLRDTALSLLRLAGCRAVAARLRHYAQFPAQAAALLAPPPPENA
jgi:predicted transposase YbfD/YdcC